VLIAVVVTIVCCCCVARRRRRRALQAQDDSETSAIALEETPRAPVNYENKFPTDAREPSDVYKVRHCVCVRC
jgi:hypothetical protein